MSDHIQPADRHSPRAISRDRLRGISSGTIGGVCVAVGAASLATAFWNADMAVQSGAVLLGVTLGVSGVIAFLAGD
jgi:hypothetical protein